MPRRFWNVITAVVPILMWIHAIYSLKALVSADFVTVSGTVSRTGIGWWWWWIASCNVVNKWRRTNSQYYHEDDNMTADSLHHCCWYS